MMNKADIAKGTSEGEEQIWDPARVRAAVEELLAGPQFRSSPQCTSFLRYIVTHTLNGEENLLRERVIGADVFGRNADYDPSADPIVRLRASDLRKRIALYYQAEGSEAAVRISVPPGAYVASFTAQRLRPQEPMLALSTQIPANTATPSEIIPGAAVTEPHANAETRVLRRWRWIAVAVLLLAGVLYGLIALRPTTTRLNALWSPLFLSKQPITVCVPDYTVEDIEVSDWSSRVAAVIAGKASRSRVNLDSKARLSVIPYVDSFAVNKLAYWFGSKRIPFEAERTSQVTIQDFRRQPAVLVGAFDNDWSLVLLSKLRFHVQIDPKSGVEWVQDASAPENQQWKSSGDLPYAADSVDYAIITRVLEPETGQWLIAIGGMGLHGTEAAADLVTDERLSSLIPSSVQTSQGNVQIVIRAEVINGHNSLPKVVAVDISPT